MKYLFYVLMLVNLVFLIWRFGLDHWPAPQRKTPVTNQLALDPLDSLSPEDAGFELLPEEPEPVSSSEGPLAADEGSPHGCLALGPFAHREAAEAALLQVRSAVQEAQIQSHSEERADGYWVLYPKASTPEGALANRQMLNNRGIYETWLFDQGPWAGAISLGLYPTQEAAESAARTFREKGIPTRVKPRLVRGASFWIRMPWEGSSLPLEESLQLLKSEAEGVLLPTPVKCP